MIPLNAASLSCRSKLLQLVLKRQLAFRPLPVVVRSRVVDGHAEAAIVDIATLEVINHRPTFAAAKVAAPIVIAAGNMLQEGFHLIAVNVLTFEAVVAVDSVNEEVKTVLRVVNVATVSQVGSFLCHRLAVVALSPWWPWSVLLGLSAIGPSPLWVGGGGAGLRSTQEKLLAWLGGLRLRPTETLGA